MKKIPAFQSVHDSAAGNRLRSIFRLGRVRSRTFLCGAEPDTENGNQSGENREARCQQTQAAPVEEALRKRSKDRTSDAARAVDDTGESYSPLLSEDRSDCTHYKSESHCSGASADEQAENQVQHPDLRTQRHQQETGTKHQSAERQYTGICFPERQRAEERLGNTVEKLRECDGEAYLRSVKCRGFFNSRSDQSIIDPDTVIQRKNKTADERNQRKTHRARSGFLFLFRLHGGFSFQICRSFWPIRSRAAASSCPRMSRTRSCAVSQRGTACRRVFLPFSESA